jgi:hypothetical protein
MIGTAVQYYLEVKDATGAVVTRSGKSTSPNLVDIEPGTSPRFYPDITDESEPVASETEPGKRDDEDDPLNRKRPPGDEPPAAAGEQPPAGAGLLDVGSQKFRYAKWGGTATAGTLLVLGSVFYIQACRYGTFLEEDSRTCGTPPCRPYDDYAADLQAAGKRYQTLSRISFGVGLAAGAVAGYFWYRELRAKKRGEVKVSARKAPEMTWVAPVIGGDAGGFVGAAAGRRF